MAKLASGACHTTDSRPNTADTSRLSAQLLLHGHANLKQYVGFEQHVESPFGLPAAASQPPTLTVPVQPWQTESVTPAHVPPRKVAASASETRVPTDGELSAVLKSSPPLKTAVPMTRSFLILFRFVCCFYFVRTSTLPIVWKEPGWLAPAGAVTVALRNACIACVKGQTKQPSERISFELNARSNHSAART